MELALSDSHKIISPVKAGGKGFSTSYEIRFGNNILYIIIIYN